MSENNKSVLSRVRDKLNDGMNRLLVTLAFVGCVQSLSSRTITGNVLEVDGSCTYLATNFGNVQINSRNLVRAVTAVNQKRGEVGEIVLDIDDNTSEVRGGWVYPTGIRVSSGISNMDYDIGSWIDDGKKLINDIKDINFRRINRDIADAAINASPERVMAEQGSCAKVIGSRIIKGEVKQGWMPIHKRGADGFYIEDGSYNTGQQYYNQRDYASASTGQQRTISINQLLKATTNQNH
jgi:hypothetical protein